MTPKEKAIQLFNRYDYLFVSSSKEYIVLACVSCVDEIIKANPTELVDGALFTINPINGMVKSNATKYWEQVKEELKNI